MTSPNQPEVPVEVEAKFLGGDVECRAITDLLTTVGCFACEKKAPVYRLHAYFDADGILHDSGCRLRCVVAAGEWCRYDFKAEDKSGRCETLEVAIKHSTPVPLAALIEDILRKLPDCPPRKRLEEIRDSAFLVLAMTGTHLKTIARRENLELEVSWDVLVPLDSGVPISEVEVELLLGERSDFDSVISRMATELCLDHISASKYERALALVGPQS